MSDRTLRTVVTALAGLLVLVVAVTLLVIVDRRGPGTASPGAPPIAVASPSAGATLSPTEVAAPTPSPTPEATATAATPTSGATATPTSGATATPTSSAAVSASPGATALATLTFVGLRLDATTDPGGEARVVRFRSDGAGTVTAKLGSTPTGGTTHMCFLVGTREIGCEDWASGTFTGRTTRTEADWTVTLQGNGANTPSVDLTVTFQAAAPAVTIEHARFDGTASPDTNGIQARFVARSPGEARLVADWGGHPFLYEVDLFDETGGSANATLSDQGPSTNVDEALPVTTGNWRLVIQNIEPGLGTTDLTATISWP
jgi:hypothetical protein